MQNTQTNTVTSEPDKLLTVKETHELLRISKWTLYELLHKRQLESVRIGRQRFIPISSITKLINDLKT